MRLGRILAELAREEPEVHGLVALMEIQTSRLGARTWPVGRAGAAARSGPGALGSLLIRRGLAALARAEALNQHRAHAGPLRCCRPRSPPATRALQGPTETDWARIVGLYGKLGEVTPSPVVELNRAVALAMLFGPEAGLDLVDALAAEPALETYHLLPSVRGDLLRQLGRLDEARAEFERAAALTRNETRAQISARSRRSVYAGVAGLSALSRVRLGGSPKLRR